jgi:uncharacterized protein
MLTIEAARAWYPQNDLVHGFDHVLRVYRTAEQLAVLEGADLEIVRAAVLLHDAQGDLAMPPADRADDTRSDHHLTSAEFARDILRGEGWSEERIAAVVHCIRAHRFRDDSQEPQTREAEILYDADKLDAIGAVGVARALAYANHAGQPAFAQPSEHFISTGLTEPGEPHSAYHEYIFKLRHLRSRLYTASAQKIAKSRHTLMVAYFDRLASEMQEHT